MGIFRKLASTAAVAALSAVVLTPAIPAAADLAVPRTTWPVCDDFRVDFCIESVSIRPLGTRSDLVLEWYDSGTGPEALPEEEPVASAITGPAVLEPGASATYTASLPEEYAGLQAIFKLTGAGTLTAEAADVSAVTATLAAPAEAGAAQLGLFVDVNADGEFSRDEQVDVWGVSIGTASQVGTGVTETMAGTAVAGRWSHPKWQTYGLNQYGYDGLTIDLKTANTFTNHLFFTVYPVKASDTNVTSRAVRADGSGKTANMSLDDKITVKVRIGEIDTGVSIGIANNLLLQSTLGDAEAEVPGTLTISGTPVPVPQVSNQVTGCSGETGVATAVVTTMQGFVLVENDNMGMGVDGLSGRMAVSTNGVSCGASTPVWDDTTESLNWIASAPHFEPDGVTPNKGFYKAIIPANDALLLWGLQDPKRAVTALNIQVTEETGGPAVFVSKISYLHGDIIIDVTGFEFSRPKIQIGKKAGATTFAKKRTLTCTDPETKEKYTATDVYGCPKAPEKPVQNFLMKSASQTALTATEKRAVNGYLNGFIEANKFICTGIYKKGANKATILAAKKRATAACKYAKQTDPTLSTFAQTKASTAASYINKVLVTMKDQKG